MGNPVVHWEMWSEDPAKVADFYKQTFDWDINHMAEMDYHMVNPGGEGGISGGIMKPKNGPWPAKLTFYLNVEELAPYREKIVAAGGKIVVEEQDVPGVGSFSMFEDPEGRLLGLWKPLPSDDG